MAKDTGRVVCIPCHSVHREIVIIMRWGPLSGNGQVQVQGTRSQPPLHRLRLLGDNNRKRTINI